jgi:CheY-like chemotaxis protein
MEEIPSPRSTNTILWVADQVNPLLVIELEAVYGYSVLCVRSNSEALEVMEKFPWLLK